MPCVRSFATSVLLVSCLSSPAVAQPASAESRKAVQILAGLGTHLTTELEEPPSSIGLFAAGEYIYWLASFISSRTYAGLLFTNTDEESCEDLDPCELSSRLVFFGQKFRLLAPIPYVAPFLELGFGFSLGTLVTRVSSVADRDLSGGTIHVPVGLGLALGRDHNYDLMFWYLFHPTEDSVSGALAAGLTFRL